MPAAEILRAQPTKTQRQPTPKPLTVRWLVRPQYDANRPGRWSGRVAMNGDLYDVTRSEATDDDTGELWVIIDLRKLGTNKQHRLCIDPAGESHCDCEWSSMRPAEDGYKA